VSSWALGVAWVLSVVSLSVSLPSEVGGGVLSRTILCVLPWIALAGLPRGADSASDAGRPWWRYFAYILPLLAVGLGMDHAAAIQPLSLLRLACGALLTTSIFAWAASRSSVSAGYACVWTVLIPLPFVLAALPEQSLLDSSRLSWLFAATPSGWALNELVSQSAEAELGFVLQRDLGFVLATALFFALSFLFRSEAAES